MDNALLLHLSQIAAAQTAAAAAQFVGDKPSLGNMRQSSFPATLSQINVQTLANNLLLSRSITAPMGMPLYPTPFRLEAASSVGCPKPPFASTLGVFPTNATFGQVPSAFVPAMMPRPLQPQLASDNINSQAPFQKDTRSVWMEQPSLKKRSWSQLENRVEIESVDSVGSVSPPMTPSPMADKSMSPAKRPRRVESGLSEFSRRSSTSGLRELIKSPRQTKHGLGGERRLNINFQNTGKHMDPPQTFGKYGLVIPDGICGTHTMYAQHWQFQITHHPGKSGEVLLKWSITNLSSGAVTAMMETTEQAFQRQTKGNTICNIVVREALNRRAQELEDEIRANERIHNITRVANLKSLVKELRPKQCTEGLLFFGLRHGAVQVQATAALRGC